MSSDYLTCRQIVELVTEYFEDALSPQDRSRFEEHIMSCPPCRAYLEQMRQTIRLLGRIPEETVPPEAEEALRAAFRGWSHD
ncbi:MAG TPA: zf-HC2 domain-containing protein [Acidimicrobiales bacterium]|jgi:anti-sigma factor RsiW|nr:zf-HC2 domain-containing protein [Acidimicrobiales bacterium]